MIENDVLTPPYSIYSIFYLHMVSLALLFSPASNYGLFTYAWTTATSGLSFLGIGSGILLGSFIATLCSNGAYVWMNARWQKKLSPDSIVEGGASQGHGPNESSHSTSASPEGRMLMLQVGMLLIPVGLILFAWTAGRTHWIVPLIGAAVFAIGFIVVYVNFQTYMVDIFGRFAASALATATILRSVLGCIFTIIGFKMYESLGYAWGTMILAFLCIAMLPLPLLLTVHGPQLRKREFTF